MRYKEIPLVVHLPETEEGKALLQDTIDTCHAEMIVAYIESLKCSVAEKKRLLDHVING